MKTIINDKLVAGPGTQSLVECLVNLNNNYYEVIKALNTAFGSNQTSSRMLTNEYLPVFLELQKVLKCFIAESVGANIEGEEVNKI